uniref:LmrA/YxaF family transcription factor n=1 Tax=Nocardioides stalactiti TaxID=2755356 RepID=UPI001FE494DE
LRSWQATLVDVMVEEGVDPERAPRLALFIVAAVEGAIALCRAEQSIAPLRGTMDEVLRLVESSLA